MKVIIFAKAVSIHVYTLHSTRVVVTAQTTPTTRPLLKTSKVGDNVKWDKRRFMLFVWRSIPTNHWFFKSTSSSFSSVPREEIRRNREAAAWICLEEEKALRNQSSYLK